jgi:DNA-binding response OmpR family regulator
MVNNLNSVDFRLYVLITECHPELRKILEVSLSHAGMKVKAVSMPKNTLQILQEDQPDVFVVDFDLGKKNAEKLIAAYRHNQKNNNGIVLVSTPNRLEDGWRKKIKPDSVIYKPFDIRYLIRLIFLLAQNQTTPI